MKRHYRIYQLDAKNLDVLKDRKLFESWERLNKNSHFDFTQYVLVYDEEIDLGDDTDNISFLEELFERFNIYKPKDFHGHSLSVSDVIDLDGTKYYCDDIGFKRIPNMTGLYLVADYNFDKAYISGVPCIIETEPYLVTDTEELMIGVTSLITNISYVIPYDPKSFKVYETYKDVCQQCSNWKNLGYTIASDSDRFKGLKNQIIGKTYVPMDNSYSSDFEGNFFNSIQDECTVLSVPFNVKDPNFGDTHPCILVKRTKDGKIGRVLFMEWRLGNFESRY